MFPPRPDLLKLCYSDPAQAPKALTPGHLHSPQQGRLELDSSWGWSGQEIALRNRFGSKSDTPSNIKGDSCELKLEKDLRISGFWGHHSISEVNAVCSAQLSSGRVHTEDPLTIPISWG